MTREEAEEELSDVQGTWAMLGEELRAALLAMGSREKETECDGKGVTAHV